MQRINKGLFFKLCKGGRLHSVENIDSGNIAGYESTVFIYNCKNGGQVCKIETRGIRARNSGTTYAFYKIPAAHAATE